MAAIDFGGHLAATSVSTGVLSCHLKLGSGAELHVAAKAVLATISLSLVTPLIEAVGDSDSFAQRVLTRHQQPLRGEHGFFSGATCSAPKSDRLAMKHECRRAVTRAERSRPEAPQSDL